MSANKNTSEPIFSFRPPKSSEWRMLTVGADADETAQKAAEQAKEDLNQTLLSSMQMEHLVVLAGSGCSLGVGGPSMRDLWNAAVGEAPSAKAKEVADKVHYSLENKNIEAFLSHIDASLYVIKDSDVEAFLNDTKKIILDECSSFLSSAKLTAHETFLHRLSRRRSRDRRLKLFTTNYDLCFERAASGVGGVAIDGFSFMAPRRYDPRYFDYDIVRRSRSGDNHGNYLEGVFLLYKLHGSVNWESRDDGIFESSAPDPKNACLIYPASGKYQQSYNQPYLESISQYLAAVREPNTCVLVIGFGFNDDHLSEPLLAAVRSNPHLRLIVIDPSIQEKSESTGSPNRFHKHLIELAAKGEDVWFVNAPFGAFAELIPDLKSLTPAERLMKAVQGIQSKE